MLLSRVHLVLLFALVLSVHGGGSGFDPCSLVQSVITEITATSCFAVSWSGDSSLTISNSYTLADTVSIQSPGSLSISDSSLIGGVLAFTAVSDVDATNSTISATDSLTITTSGDISLEGDVIDASELSFSGVDITLESLDTGGSVFLDASGNLTISGSIDIEGSLNVTASALEVDDTITAQSVRITSNYSLVGDWIDATSGDIIVDGPLQFQSDLQGTLRAINGSISLQDGLILPANLTLIAAAGTTINGDVDVSGSLSVIGALNIVGNVSMILSSEVNVQGDLQSSGEVYIQTTQDIIVTGELSANLNATLLSDSSILIGGLDADDALLSTDGSVTVLGDMDLDDTLRILGNTVDLTGDVYTGEEIYMESVFDLHVNGYVYNDDEDLTMISLQGSINVTDYVEADDGDIVIQAGDKITIGTYIDSYENIYVEATNDVVISTNVYADDGNATLISRNGNIIVGEYVETDDLDILIEAAESITIGEYVYSYSHLTMKASEINVAEYIDAGEEIYIEAEYDINVGEYVYNDDENLTMISIQGSINVTEEVEADDGDILLQAADTITIGTYIDSYEGLHVEATNDIYIVEYVYADDGNATMISNNGSIIVGEYVKTDDLDIVLQAAESITIGEFVYSYAGLSMKASEINVAEYLNAGDEIYIEAEYDINVGEYVFNDDEDLTMISIQGSINVTQYVEADDGDILLQAGDTIMIGTYLDSNYGLFLESQNNILVTEYAFVYNSNITMISNNGSIIVGQYVESWGTDILLQAAEAINVLTYIAPVGNLTMSAGSINVGDYVKSGASILVETAGDISLGDVLTANDDLTVKSLNGSILVVGNITTNTGDLSLQAEQSITAPVILSAGSLDVQANFLNVTEQLNANGSIVLEVGEMIIPVSVRVMNVCE